MNAQQFARTLHELEAERVPADLDLWPRLRARVAAQPRGARPGRSLPITRLGWVALAVAGLLLLSTTAYATAPTIGRLLRLFEPQTMGQGESLGQQLSLSQTIGDVTVSVEWACADAERIRIGYTVRSRDGRRFDPCPGRLADAEGRPMPWTMGYGVTGESDRLGVALPPGEGSYVAVFANEAHSEAAGETLKLRLELEVEELILPTPAAATEPAAGPAGPGSVLLEPLPAGERLGPFTFEFSIPVMANSAK